MHPEHTADFEKSGLTFETVAALGLHTVPPYKIKHLPGVNHAYRIPYFQLDGSTNCFERLKLFPPIKTKDGHTKKYHQEKGSDPQLYLPSLRPWAELPGQ